MLFIILRDACLIFFVIYGIITLSEQIVRLVLHNFCKTKNNTEAFIVLNMQYESQERIEMIVRKYMYKYKEKIYVIHSSHHTELSAMLYVLSRKYEQLIPITKEKMSKIILENDENFSLSQ